MCCSFFKQYVNIDVFLLDHSWPIFVPFRLFYKQLRGNWSLKVADDRIRTRVLWCPFNDNVTTPRHKILLFTRF